MRTAAMTPSTGWTRGVQRRAVLVAVMAASATGPARGQPLLGDGSAPSREDGRSLRLEAMTERLRRAARGSRIGVEIDGGRIRVAAFGDEAFAVNRSEPHTTLRAFLDELTDHPEDRVWLQIEVIGHARRGGVREANERLALQRATAVQRHLTLRGARVRPAPRAVEGADRGIELLLSDTDP